MRKPFKLRSGNTTPFKQIGSSPVKRNGENKETMEQYNTRVLADYKSKLQAHSDSTAAYNRNLEMVNNQKLYSKISNPKFSEQEIRETKGTSAEGAIEKLSTSDQGTLGMNTAKLNRQNIKSGIYADYDKAAEEIGVEDWRKSTTGKSTEQQAVENAKVFTQGGKQLKPGPPPAKPNVGKLHHSKYYDAKAKEYRVTSYNPKKLKSGKYSSTGRGKKISDMSLAEWKRKYNKN